MHVFRHRTQEAPKKPKAAESPDTHEETPQTTESQEATATTQKASEKPPAS